MSVHDLGNGNFNDRCIGRNFESRAYFGRDYRFFFQSQFRSRIFHKIDRVVIKLVSFKNSMDNEKQLFRDRLKRCLKNV